MAPNSRRAPREDTDMQSQKPLTQSTQSKSRKERKESGLVRMFFLPLRYLLFPSFAYFA